jgi:hypothetical protein
MSYEEDLADGRRWTLKDPDGQARMAQAWPNPAYDDVCRFVSGPLVAAAYARARSRR